MAFGLELACDTGLITSGKKNIYNAKYETQFFDV